MNASRRAVWLPWVALATVWLGWGSTYLGISAAVETIPPLLMTALRFFLAAPVLIAFAIPAWLRGEVRLTARQVWGTALTGVLLFVGATAVVGITQQHLDSSYTALLVSISPIWMAMFSGFFSRTLPSPKVFAALVVGVVGIGILAGGPGSGEISLLWTIVAASTTVSWSLGTVLSRHLDMPRHPTLVSGLQMLFGGGTLLPLSALLGEWQQLNLAAISGRSVAGLLWLVVVGSLISYSAYVYANRSLPIELVSTYAYVNPVVAVVLGATLDNDPIGPNVIVGGTVILLAVVFIVSGHVVRRRASS